MNISIQKINKYLDWLKQKIFLDSIVDSAKKRVVKRGQVYECNLGVGIGSEESKKRPCVIIQYNSANLTSPNTIVAPITHASSTLPVVVPIIPKKNPQTGEIILDGYVLLGNIVTVSKARLGNYITTLTRDEMKKIDEAIAMSTGIKHHYKKLENKYNDKLDHINRLYKKINEIQEELNEKEKIIEVLEELRNELGLKDIKDLIEFIRERVSETSNN